MQNMFISVSSAQARYRSGAVARMVGIPVSTLRIWERRYQVVGPTLTDSGHRLYTGADVERLLLIRQLIQLGHAVGTVARLSSAELQQITDARSALGAPPASGPPKARVALLGLGLPRRLGHLALRRTGTWADLAAAEAEFALASPAGLDPLSPDSSAPQAELLVAEMATLQPASAERLLALQKQLGAQRVVLVYGFGAEVAAQRLRNAGCRLHRAPLAEAELRNLVDTLLAELDAQAAPQPPANDPAASALRTALATDPPARRFADADLALLATTSNSVACECPRHLTDLVVQLGAFETYSAECLASQPGDAELHRHLQRVAGTARALIESALLQVARAEGLPVPA